MKWISGIATALAAVLMVVGCGKKESEPPTAQVPKHKSPASAPSSGAAPVSLAGEKVSEIAAQAAALIEQARTHLNEREDQVALDVLQKVSALKLTSEQQKLVQELQATALRKLAYVARDKAAAKPAKPWAVC